MVDSGSPQNHLPRFCLPWKLLRGRQGSLLVDPWGGASHHPPPLHTHLCAGWSPHSLVFLQVLPLVHAVCLQDCWREARKNLVLCQLLSVHFCFFHLWKNQQCKAKDCVSKRFVRCARAGDEDSMGASCCRSVMRQDRALQRTFPPGNFSCQKMLTDWPLWPFFWFYHPVISTDIWLSIL